MPKRPVKLASWIDALKQHYFKVAHHGSRTSATPLFMAAVHPQFAVISVGARNPFGLPKIDVLERLQAAGIPTYRTDMDGAATFLLDGQRVIAQKP